MYLLYLDDAGSPANLKEDYFVLAGVAVFEEQISWLTQEMDKLAQRFDAENPGSVEFHASEIFARRTHPWKNMNREEAQGVIQEVLNIVARSYKTVRVFACAVHKDSYPNDDPVKIAFEDLCSRFDQYLRRLKENGDSQKGLIILDQGSDEQVLLMRKMTRDFQTAGTQWGGVIRNLVDIPFFVDSRASRLVQIADHIAYSVFRRYNAKDTRYFDVFASKFDMADNVIHGLAHKQVTDQLCMCPACLSRRISPAGLTGKTQRASLDGK